MSQRGAQQMANEGFAYDQILEFYYPGLTRTRYTMTRTLLDSMDGTPSAPSTPENRLRMRKPAVVTLKNPLDSPESAPAFDDGVLRPGAYAARHADQPDQPGGRMEPRAIRHADRLCR